MFKKTILGRAVIYLLVFYLLISTLMFFMQWNMLYPAGAGVSSVERARDIIDSIEEYSVQIPSGRIRLFYAKGENDKVIIFYHGNAQNMESTVKTARPFYDKGYGILTCSYPGYDGNRGRKRARNLYYAAEACMEFLVRQKSLAHEDIILHGYSLGGHLGLYVAQKRMLHAVLLLAPLGSALDIAKESYPLLPVRLILQDRLVSYGMARNVITPAYLVHNEYDNVIPYEQGLRIYENISSDIKHMSSIDYLIPGDNGHAVYSYGIREDILDWLNTLKP